MSNFYAKLSLPVQAAIRTFLQSFLVVFGVYLFNFAMEIQKWADADSGAFPDVNPLAKGLAAAVTAGIVALFSYLHNKFLPGVLPYQRKVEVPETNGNPIMVTTTTGTGTFVDPKVTTTTPANDVEISSSDEGVPVDTGVVGPEGELYVDEGTEGTVEGTGRGL